MKEGTRLIYINEKGKTIV